MKHQNGYDKAESYELSETVQIPQTVIFMQIDERKI